MKQKQVKRCCPVCKHKGVTTSSAIDGRAKYICDACGRWWTEGKKVGQGYKDWLLINQNPNFPLLLN